MIGCPIRNRAWILPEYLKSLTSLDYPAACLRYRFIVNDCIDSTLNILRTFADEHPHQVKIVTQDWGIRRTNSHLRGYYCLNHLARLRNQLLEAFLASDCHYLFSVDSDIIMPASSLKQLLADECEIVSALVCNGHEIGNASIYNILRRTADNRWVHILDFPRDRIFEVDCTGAAYLIKRNVIEDYGIRYSAFQGAEDIGFCREAGLLGLRIYCDGRVEGEHRMNESEF
jgi:hypothetical protein